MPILNPECIPGLTKTGRYYQLYLALGGDFGCFFGLTLIEQLRLILDLIGSEECIYTEQGFYAAWLEFLSPGACTGMTVEYLQKAVYAILYAEAGDDTLPPPECFLGLPDEDRDVALILAVTDTNDDIMFDLTELTISGAGSTNVLPPSSLLRTVLGSVEAGSGTYNLTLSTIGAETGQRIEIFLTWDTDSLITIQVNGGTLFQESGDGLGPAYSELSFVFNGTAWESAGINEIVRAAGPAEDPWVISDANFFSGFPEEPRSVSGVYYGSGNHGVEWGPEPTGADIEVSFDIMYLYAAAASQLAQVNVIVRGSISGNAYALDVGAGGVALFKITGGSGAVMGTSVGGSPTMEGGIWYSVTFTLQGSSISAKIRQRDTGFYLQPVNGSTVWGDEVNTLAATDSDYTAIAPVTIVATDGAGSFKIENFQLLNI